MESPWPSSLPELQILEYKYHEHRPSQPKSKKRPPTRCDSNGTLASYKQQKNQHRLSSVARELPSEPSRCSDDDDNNMVGVEKGGASSNAEFGVDFIPNTMKSEQSVFEQIADGIMDDGSSPQLLTSSYGSRKGDVVIVEDSQRDLDMLKNTRLDNDSREETDIVVADKCASQSIGLLLSSVNDKHMPRPITTNASLAPAVCDTGENEIEILAASSQAMDFQSATQNVTKDDPTGATTGQMQQTGHGDIGMRANGVDSTHLCSDHSHKEDDDDGSDENSDASMPICPQGESIAVSSDEFFSDHSRPVEPVSEKRYSKKIRLSSKKRRSFSKDDRSSSKKGRVSRKKRQRAELCSLILKEHDVLYEVENIIASQVDQDQLQYQVQWSGYPSDLVWYPASNFKTCPVVLEDYHDNLGPEHPRPKRLKQWLECFGDHRDDDKPESVVVHSE